VGRVPTRISPHVDRYLRVCFAEGDVPRLEELARRLRISRVTLGKRFREEAGISLGKYITAARITCAKRLLTTTKLTMPTIARRSAFGDERSFRRAFLRETKSTPAAYRRAHRV